MPPKMAHNLAHELDQEPAQELQITTITTDSNPIEILIHANVKLGNFLKSMMQKQKTTTENNFNQYNINDIKLEDIKKIQYFEDDDNRINILQKQYISELNDYLNADNILKQYIALLYQLTSKNQ
tara:strand:- start:471 stop:845 length:375 start_codon:yes stop_codon:yes gene_type:complete